MVIDNRDSQVAETLDACVLRRIRSFRKERGWSQCCQHGCKGEKDWVESGFHYRRMGVGLQAQNAECVAR